MRKRLLAATLFLAFAGFAVFALYMLRVESAAAAEPPARVADDRSEEEMKFITMMTNRIFSTYHYRKLKQDDDFSQRLFDRYFLALDPNRIYFTAADVERFAPYRDRLVEMLKNGDNSFAFGVYDLFCERNREFYTFSMERLKQPFDFTLDETYMPDRSKAPWAADMAELRKLWEKRLKNDILYYRLLNRSVEEAKAAGKNKNGTSAWSKTPEERVSQRLRDINNALEKSDRVDVLGGFLNTLAGLYGPHSNYLSPKRDEDFTIGMQLSLTGIGATLTSDGGYIKVVAIVPGGPAARDGRLKVEDRIITVTQENGEATDVIDMPVGKAVQYIRGAENSKVTLTILPAEKGANAIPENLTIVRGLVRLVESEAKGEIKFLPGPDGVNRKVGVISLPSFYMDYEAAMRGDKDYKSCSRDVKRILEGFNREKVDAVVMDLRRNGGGLLSEAISLTGLFITTGPVVQIRNSDRKVEVRSDEDPAIDYTGPLVILVSKLTASSSEIFTGALRDAKRAVVVGDSRTFGKGTVLDVVPLERYLRYIGRKFQAGSATYETAMFYRPSGGSVQQLGIEPDIRLPSLTDELEIGEMFMDNHLPWDAIGKVKVTAYDPKLEEKITLLREVSGKRMAHNADFRKLQTRIKLLNQYKNRKEVSLNEETRWKEYLGEKEMQEETEKLYQDETAPENKDEKFDPVLDEAARVAVDLAEIKN